MSSLEWSQIEEGTERPRNDGGLQRVQQVSRRKWQEMRIASTPQEESWWQSTATWEQWVEQKKGRLSRFQENEGRIAQAWVNVRGGLRIFPVYFWHSEGWSSRSEALLEAVLIRTRTTKHPWLIACGANTSPEDFEKSLWFWRDQMHVIAPAGVSTCRSKKCQKENKLRRYMTM